MSAWGPFNQTNIPSIKCHLHNSSIPQATSFSHSIVADSLYWDGLPFFGFSLNTASNVVCDVHHNKSLSVSNQFMFCTFDITNLLCYGNNWNPADNYIASLILMLEALYMMSGPDINSHANHNPQLTSSWPLTGILSELTKSLSSLEKKMWLYCIGSLLSFHGVSARIRIYAISRERRASYLYDWKGQCDIQQHLHMYLRFVNFHL